MATDQERNSKSVASDTVPVTVRFISILKEYSGGREIEMDLPRDPATAIDIIVDRFQMPWKDQLEKSSRIFINKELSDVYIQNGGLLDARAVIAFIPISGGG